MIWATPQRRLWPRCAKLRDGMNLGKFPKLILAVSGLLIASEGLACSIVIDPDRTVVEHRRQVRDVLARVSAIVDGEVVRPHIEGKQNALVYAFHVLKGPEGPWFEVIEVDSCAIRLDRVGERSRMLLTKLPEGYVLYYDQSDARIEDQLLKSDRRKVWPYRPGRKAVP